MGTEIIKENQVFKEVHYSGKINKAKGIDNSVFMVTDDKEAKRGNNGQIDPLWIKCLWEGWLKKKNLLVYCWESCLQIPRLRFSDGWVS